MSGMPSKFRAAGFTIFELLMVMVVAAILVGLGVPSFKYVTTGNRIAAELNLLAGDLQYARAEAIKEGEPVTVCATTDNTTCVTSGNTWNTGWIVFVDVNANKSIDTATDTVLRKRQSFSAASGSTDTLTASATTFWGITFNREGYAPTGSATAVNLQLHSSPTVNNWTRCLQVTPVGALTVELYNVGNPACQ